MDTILALLKKPNVENVPLQELGGNNSENVYVNFNSNYGFHAQGVPGLHARVGLVVFSYFVTLP